MYNSGQNIYYTCLNEILVPLDFSFNRNKRT